MTQCTTALEVYFYIHLSRQETPKKELDVAINDLKI